MDATCSDEKAIAEFYAWSDAHHSEVPVSDPSFDLYAWTDRIPPEHKRGFSHWLGRVLEAANDKSRDLVHH